MDGQVPKVLFPCTCFAHANVAFYVYCHDDDAMLRDKDMTSSLCLRDRLEL